MTFTYKCVLTGAIFIATLLLAYNLLAKRYNAGISNVMSIGACLFILFSHSNPDALCMMGIEETTSSQQKDLITGARKTDSGDHDQLGTVEMQLDFQEKRAEELECKTQECQKAASFSHGCAVGSVLGSIPTSPVSKGLAVAAIAAEELSSSYASAAVDASKGLEITKETISALKGMKSS